MPLRAYRIVQIAAFVAAALFLLTAASLAFHLSRAERLEAEILRHEERIADLELVNGNLIGENETLALSQHSTERRANEAAAEEIARASEEFEARKWDWLASLADEQAARKKAEGRCDYLQTQVESEREKRLIAERLARAAARSSPRDPGLIESDGSPVLELIEWKWCVDGEIAEVTGRVRNLTRSTLQDIVVVVSFFAGDKSFIKHTTMSLEFDPLLPGQVSPFRILAIADKRVESAQVEFKERGGGTIPWRKAR